VKPTAWLALAILLFSEVHLAVASNIRQPFQVHRLNRKLQGQVIDHTNRHDRDRRIWSEALQQKRDLYVYLPPGFDPGHRYPVIFWLHGFAQDEHSFLDYVVERIDKAMVCGDLPRAILVAPDGSLSGRECLLSAGSFFINSRAGRFEDFLMQDIWTFVHETYPLRPEAEAHVLAGVSMGGGAAFNLAIKHRDRVKVVIGIFPPLNTRWLDCHCRYMSNFDPNCWGWRTDVSRGHEVVGRFYGVVTVRLKRILDPVYDRRDPATLLEISEQNPIEMIDRLNLKEGELEMYVGYGGRDQFNIDAQVESFLYVAKQRGLTVGVGYVPRGKHDYPTADKLFPGVMEWLRPRLAPYSP
jgi:S-formylglutathione hydrolase FrmB